MKLSLDLACLLGGEKPKYWMIESNGGGDEGKNDLEKLIQ